MGGRPTPGRRSTGLSQPGAAQVRLTAWALGAGSAVGLVGPAVQVHVMAEFTMRSRIDSATTGFGNSEYQSEAWRLAVRWPAVALVR